MRVRIVGLCGLVLASALWLHSQVPFNADRHGGPEAAAKVIASPHYRPVAGPAREAVRTDLGRLPVSFVANRGRWDTRASWVAPGAEATAYFGDRGVRWALAPTGEKPGWALHQGLMGARAGTPTASVPAAGLVSYFVGEHHHAALPTATELTLADAWPGIDVVWSGVDGRIETTYRVAPGADPARIRVAWEGADGLAVTHEGRLSVSTPVRSFEEDAPRAFQDRHGARVPVAVAFELDAAGGYGFRLGSYDPALPLVIDPTVLVYAGFLGGTGWDVCTGIAVDGAGNAYVTGWTQSSQATFPDTPGAFQLGNPGGASDAFVVKIDRAGSALVYASFLGGTSRDLGTGIAVDGRGNAYLTGWTQSTAATFPDTSGVFQSENAGGGTDAFVAKVNPTGSALVYASFLGGREYDFGYGIAVDGAGNAYVTGWTGPRAAIDPHPPPVEEADAFVVKVNRTASSQLYSRLLGGGGLDFGYGVAVDGAGNAYVTGSTRSTTFPVTPGVFQPNSAGNFDAFVVKVNRNGSALLYAGFLGGSGWDEGRAIAVDGAGNAYVTGSADSTSTAASFPATPGVFQPENAGYDAFVAKVNPSGSTLVYAGFLGGAGGEFGSGIVVDGAGNAYVTGGTSSTAASFPATPGVFQPENAGDYDAFVAKVNRTGSGLVYAGFLGGARGDFGFAIAVDGAGNAYITGRTESTTATFPVTPGVFQPEGAGGGDGFVAKIGHRSTPPP
jgi:hypothetical protein